ncbi:MAG: VanZ family protein [Phycisphaerae bacterium]|nr:VanZ family protein [Phycisphaerae bacterium]
MTGTMRDFRTWLKRTWLAYWIVLFYFTHSPEPGWPGWAPETSDKTLHLIAFFLLGGLGWLTLSTAPTSPRWRAIDWIGVIIVYAACDEVLQCLCNRYCSLGDMIADIIGAVAAIVLITVLRAIGLPGPWHRRHATN